MSSLPQPLFLDLLMPGHRMVPHRLVIEPSAELASWTFVACGSDGLGPATSPVVLGEPFPFMSKYDTRIYAVRQGEPIPVALTDEWRAAHVSAPSPVASVNSVPSLWPTESVVTTLRVERLDDRAFVLAVASEDSTYSAPLLAFWIGIAALAAGAIFGLVRLRRRMRAKHGAGCNRC